MPANVLDENGFAPPTNVRKTLGIPARDVTLAQHWLKNAAGAYLHFSGDGCALEKAYRWQGTAEQAKKLRAAHPFARPFKALVPASV